MAVPPEEIDASSVGIIACVAAMLCLAIKQARTSSPLLCHPPFTPTQRCKQLVNCSL